VGEISGYQLKAGQPVNSEVSVELMNVPFSEEGERPSVSSASQTAPEMLDQTTVAPLWCQQGASAQSYESRSTPVNVARKSLCHVVKFLGDLG
jgi:hypothetical protein